MEEMERRFVISFPHYETITFQNFLTNNLGMNFLFCCGPHDYYESLKKPRNFRIKMIKEFGADIEKIIDYRYLFVESKWVNKNEKT